MKLMRNGKKFTQSATYGYNEKRNTAEYTGHPNPKINAIHSNPNLSRDEKIAAAKKIMTAANQKSKVCIIANRLIKQGYTRSSAFCKAWAIVKAETINTKVSGVTFAKRQTALERLTKYDAQLISIELQRDTTNEHDNNAIAVIATVKDKGSYKMGYLPRTLSATIAPLIDYGKAVTAKFQEVRGKYQNYHNYGLAVSVSI